MKPIHTLVVRSLCITSGCNAPMPNSVAWNSAEDAAEITALMDSQQQAWNRGDLSEFMQPYWQNDSLQFIGSSGLTHGWQRTLSNYQKSYPDKEAMGRLQFTNLSTDVLDSTHAHIIGKWQLFRSADTLAGHYTLLWKKMKGQWVIVADHSS